MRTNNDVLSKREEEVLEFIKRYMKREGTTPTIREICEGIKLNSTSSVHTYFQRLVDKGYIKQYEKGSSRYSVKGMNYAEIVS